MKYTKVTGLRNDFILVNGIEEKVANPNYLAKKACKDFDVDGLILVLKSKKADFKMRIFNPDGSEAEMCGNGIRCMAKYVYEHGLTAKRELRTETIGGIIKTNLINSLVEVDMGKPVLERGRIPMKGKKGRVINEELKLNGKTLKITCVSVGNPHCVVFVDEVDSYPVEKIGKIIENHRLFPKRVNAEFVQVVDKNNLIMRVWERGVGETLACGTGASAATVAAFLNKKINRKVTVNLQGGDLEIEYNKNGHIYMVGPAEEIEEGEI